MRFRCPTCRAQYELSEKQMARRELFVRCKRCGFLVEAQANRLSPAEIGDSVEQMVLDPGRSEPRDGRSGVVVVVLVIVAVLWAWIAGAR